MARVSTLVASLLLVACSARGQDSADALKAVDLYRSGKMTSEALGARLGSSFFDYARLRYEDRSKKAQRLKAAIESKIIAMGDFAFVELYYGEYANSAGRSAYLTVDLVDSKDAKARMPFRPAPEGRFADPGGLLAAWKRYDAAGLALSRRGLVSDDERPRCPAFYCRWGSGTRELSSLEDRIATGAEPNKAALIKIAREDGDPANRAAALYVLSYTKDGADLAKLMLAALDDPAEEPRAAALLVVNDLALYDKGISVDINRIAPVLDYPTVSDRHKALAVIQAEADDPAYRSSIISQVVPRLLPLLKLSQPANHDPAFTLLCALSGESYDRRDYVSWEKWIQAQAATASMASMKNDH